MADRLLTTYKQEIAVLQLEPSGGGCFEVSVDGNLIYSKLKTGNFPDEDEIIKQVARHVRS